MEQNTQNPQDTSFKTPVTKIGGSASLFSKLLPFILVVIVIVAGGLSGLVLASRTKSASREVKSTQAQEEVPKEVKESLAQTFRDEAEGTIQKNDTLDKYVQGTHKLLRPGGESQTAYLTSSVLDLDQYVGKKVKVFGETFGSSQVGWLMDVGKVENIQ